MCRNVVIYFAAQTKADIWSRMVAALRRSPLARG